jgi:UDP:flavonoid glycosyltransferase YjiC (YdhE family)
MLKFIGRMRKLATFEILRQSLDDAVEACRGTDAILYTPLGAAGYHIAEKMELPSLYMALQPASRSREAPSIFAPALPLGSTYNWWTTILTEQAIWQLARIPFNRWRRESLGLPAMPFSGPSNLLYRDRQPFIYGYSEYVAPRPVDWPAWHHITGYWFLPREKAWSPPPELVSFLSEGVQPISIGFGSMSGAVAQRLSRLAIEACAISGHRAVLLGGWAGAKDLDLPCSICAVDSVPHDWLFPRMAAVVHHGGAGTTAAGQRAGMPSILVPFFGDQPFWARRVHALGVGPKPVMRSRLTAERLAEALTLATSDEDMRARASQLGEKIRAEHGVATAVEIVTKHLSGGSAG